MVRIATIQTVIVNWLSRFISHIKKTVLQTVSCLLSPDKINKLLIALGNSLEAHKCTKAACIPGTYSSLLINKLVTVQCQHNPLLLTNHITFSQPIFFFRAIVRLRAVISSPKSPLIVLQQELHFGKL